ncbi:MAG: sterol desaturase family protein [Paracoccaceae bacterium]|nr:sterol desaturase family protein [Paracoccaceae bacterium]MDG2258501.1 sterol desaturase family protein [Paracoccaceae bacterium]
MNDLKLGTEDNRGYWRPNKPIRYPNVFIWPPSLFGILRWIPKYLFPWAFIYALLSVGVFFFLTPPIEAMKSMSISWIGLIFLRNVALLITIVGIQHYWLYIRKSQGTVFKYNRKWPQDRNSSFTFNNQTKDNIFWSLVSGVPIWTMWESIAWWLYANGHIAQLTIGANPMWFVLLWFLVPLLHELHFYCVHRLIHVPWIYKHVHHIHHRNTNPGPWSGLSMHPIEHLLYFSGTLIYFIVPAHPIHFLNVGMLAGLSPAQGHTGFDRVVTGEESTFHLPYYAHYLHHRYFEVNYADGSIPLDRWFGTFHDGSDEAGEKLKQRRIKMNQKRK